MALSIQQKRFVSEYLIDYSATQAAIRAGYSAQSAGQLGHQLVHHPEIADAIETEIARLAADNGDMRDRIIRELSKIAFANAHDYGGNFEDLTRDQAAAISEITVTTKGDERYVTKIKLYDKGQAMERLCKMLGLDQPRKVELVSRNINLDAADPQDAARIYADMVKGD